MLMVDISETADDDTAAVFDRMFRACSGKRARVVAAPSSSGMQIAFFDRVGAVMKAQEPEAATAAAGGGGGGGPAKKLRKTA